MSHRAILYVKCFETGFYFARQLVYFYLWYRKHSTHVTRHCTCILDVSKNYTPTISKRASVSRRAMDILQEWFVESSDELQFCGGVQEELSSLGR